MSEDTEIDTPEARALVKEDLPEDTFVIGFGTVSP